MYFCGMGLMQDRGYDCFEWDEGNTGKNLKSHNVSDREAEEAFLNIPYYDSQAIKYQGPEKRRIVFSKTNAGRMLFVVYTERGTCIRVICARDMHKSERKIDRERIETNP